MANQNNNNSQQNNNSSQFSPSQQQQQDDQIARGLGVNNASLPVSRGAGSSSVVGKEGERSGAGLVLTKVGDVAVDLSKIPENPPEADIFTLIEKSGGEPFIIRENGVLMKVTASLGSDGKPKIVHGKVQYKKTRLKADQEKLILRDVNAQRELKEVQADPTRKYRLDELIRSLQKK